MRQKPKLKYVLLINDAFKYCISKVPHANSINLANSHQCHCFLVYILYIEKGNDDVKISK